MEVRLAENLIAMAFVSLPRSARRISFFEAMLIAVAVDLAILYVWY